MSIMESPVNVLEYSDYRLFLHDYYTEAKARNPKFSYRYISQKVGYRSPSFFSHIISGRSNISSEMMGRFASFLGLKKKEADYFEALVLFNQATNHEEKKRNLEKLLSFRNSKVRILEADRYEFFEKWYYLAIRESLYFQPFKGDYDALAHSLAPAIKPQEAKQAIVLLKRLGMIRKDAQGRYVRADTLSDSTGSESRSVALNNFHLQALQLAGEAIDRFPREERSISTLTLSLSNKGYKIIDEEMTSFRDRIRKLAEKDNNENSVYHMNISLFPLTKSAASGEK